MNKLHMALLMNMLYIVLLLMNMLYIVLLLMNMFLMMLWYQHMTHWCQLRIDHNGLTYLMEKLDVEKCVAEYMRCHLCFHKGH